MNKVLSNRKDLPADIKTTQLIKALKKLGFTEEKSSGSHYKLRAPNGDIFPIPRHNITKTTVVKTALKRLGIPFEQFNAVYNSVIIADYIKEEVKRGKARKSKRQCSGKR